MSGSAAEDGSDGAHGEHVVVRSAREEDAARVAPLIDHHPMFGRYGWSATALAASLRDALAAGHYVEVAHVAGEPAGFAWGVPKGAFARSGYVRLVVVGQAYVGKGVADAVMTRLEQRLMGVAPDVFLLVNETNARAIRFYERRGYRRVGSIESYVVAGESEGIFRKTMG